MKINYEYSELDEKQKEEFEKIINEIFDEYDNSKVNLNLLNTIYVIKNELIGEKYKILSGDKFFNNNIGNIAFCDNIIIGDNSAKDASEIMHEMIHVSDFKRRDQGNNEDEISMIFYKEYVAYRYINQKYSENKKIVELIDTINRYYRFHEYKKGNQYIPYILGLIRNNNNNCDDKYIRNIIGKTFKVMEYTNQIADIFICLNSIYSKFDEIYPNIYPKNIFLEFNKNIKLRWLNMEFELEEMKQDTKELFNRLYELYNYDFSEYYLDDIDGNGLFESYKYFDSYFTEEKRHAYYIKVENKYAGFVLINNYPPLTKDKDTNSIAEFFILRKYRRSGLGTKVALKVFDMFPGKWEFKVLNKNTIGMKFWKGLIDDFVEGYKVDSMVDNGYEFTIYNFKWLEK